MLARSHTVRRVSLRAVCSDILRSAVQSMKAELINYYSSVMNDVSQTVEGTV